MARFAGAPRPLPSYFTFVMFFVSALPLWAGFCCAAHDPVPLYVPLGIGSVEQVIPCSLDPRKGTHKVRVFSYINTQAPYDRDNPQVDTYIDAEPLTKEDEYNLATMSCVDLDKKSAYAWSSAQGNWREPHERPAFHQSRDWLGVRVTPDIIIWVKAEFDGVFADEVTTASPWCCVRIKKTCVIDRYEKHASRPSSLLLWQQSCALVCEIVFSGATYLPYYDGRFRSNLILNDTYSRTLCCALFDKKIALHFATLPAGDNQSMENVRLLQAAYLAKVVCCMSAPAVESEEEATDEESESKVVSAGAAYEVLGELAKDFRFDPEWAVHRDEKVVALSAAVRNSTRALYEVKDLYFALIDATKKAARLLDKTATTEDYYRSFQILHAALSAETEDRTAQLELLMTVVRDYATRFEGLRRAFSSPEEHSRQQLLHRMLAHLRGSGNAVPVLVSLMPIVALTRLLEQFAQTQEEAAALFPKWCGEIALCAASQGSDRLASTELLRVLICLGQREEDPDRYEDCVQKYRELFFGLLYDALTAEVAERGRARWQSSRGDHRMQVACLLSLATEKMAAISTDDRSALAALNALLELLTRFKETRKAATAKLKVLAAEEARRAAVRAEPSDEILAASSTSEEVEEDASPRRSPGFASVASALSASPATDDDNPLTIGLLSGRHKEQFSWRTWIGRLARSFKR